MSSVIAVEVLLVEDSPDDAELTLRALRKNNLANHVVHVKDGEQALTWLFSPDATVRNLPKVVLLDLKLPKVDGLEVLRAIRAHEHTRLVPVVVLTSSREEQDLVRSYQLGVNSYIVKPVDFEKFTRAVMEAGHYWLLVNERPK